MCIRDRSEVGSALVTRRDRSAQEGSMSTLRFAFVCAAALAVGCAGSSGSSKTEAPLRREDTAAAQIQMRVKAVDQKKRLVTVVDASGGEATFEADPAVKNFP